jgi:hypothetical protein
MPPGGGPQPCLRQSFRVGARNVECAMRSGLLAARAAATFASARSKLTPGSVWTMCSARTAITSGDYGSYRHQRLGLRVALGEGPGHCFGLSGKRSGSTWIGGRQGIPAIPAKAAACRTPSGSERAVRNARSASPTTWAMAILARVSVRQPE